MIKLLRFLKKKDIFFIFICICLIVFQVWLELRMPEYMSSITKLVTTEGNKMGDIIQKGGLMLLCAGGSMLTAIFVGYFASKLSASFASKLREMVFKKVQKMDVYQVKKYSTGSLITRTTNDVTHVEMFISMGLQMLIKAPIMAVWAITKIIDKSLDLSILVAAGVLILLITVGSIMIVVAPRFKKIQELIDGINKSARENLMGIRVIRAFNAEKFQGERFDKVNDELIGVSLTVQKTFALMMPMMNFVMHFLTLGIYFVGSLLIVKAGMVAKIDLFSNIVVFSSYGIQVIMSFLMLALIFMIFPRANACSIRINEVLNEEVTIVDGINSQPKEIGTVVFNNVSFKYPDADEYLLKNISFEVKKGETIAFIGSTGSGKSTLINLIPRFYDVTDGEVLVDGVDVREYKLNRLNELIGYVSQKACIFTGSVKENVAFGGKEISTDKVKEAIKVAQAEDFVSKMENGLDEGIARGGTNVSGGQKQRLSIARAIAKNPEIYIFDDTFSALDYQTDAKLRKELKKHTKDATTLIVAQRIGTIMHADKIIVLDNGECVGMGTHKELLKKCEVYKEIALSQLSKEELDNA